MHFGSQKCSFRKSDQKVNVRLDLPEREQGIPDSGPDSIHGRPGLLKHVAFSVPLHSNYITKEGDLACTGARWGERPSLWGMADKRQGIVHIIGPERGPLAPVR